MCIYLPGMCAHMRVHMEAKRSTLDPLKLDYRWLSAS